MGNTAGCVRIDEDTDRGGFVFTSTIPGSDGEMFYDYTEVYHFFERISLGYFDGVQNRAREMALKFGAPELTPLNAEYAAKNYKTTANA